MAKRRSRPSNVPDDTQAVAGMVTSIGAVIEKRFTFELDTHGVEPSEFFIDMIKPDGENLRQLVIQAFQERWILSVLWKGDPPEAIQLKATRLP